MAKFATALKGLSKNKIAIFIAGMILATIILHFACGGLHQCAAFRSESYESPEQLEAELNALLQEISKAPELQSMEGVEANPDVEVSDDQHGPFTIRANGCRFTFRSRYLPAVEIVKAHHQRSSGSSETSRSNTYAHFVFTLGVDRNSCRRHRDGDRRSINLEAEGPLTGKCHGILDADRAERRETRTAGDGCQNTKKGSGERCGKIRSLFKAEKGHLPLLSHQRSVGRDSLLSHDGGHSESRKHRNKRVKLFHKGTIGD